MAWSNGALPFDLTRNAASSRKRLALVLALLAPLLLLRAAVLPPLPLPAGFDAFDFALLLRSPLPPFAERLPREPALPPPAPAPPPAATLRSSSSASSASPASPSRASDVLRLAEESNDSTTKPSTLSTSLMSLLSLESDDEPDAELALLPLLALLLLGLLLTLVPLLATCACSPPESSSLSEAGGGRISSVTVSEPLRERRLTMW
mmetsp:Transcript_11108/g.38691  ORF Transcript_11108/g.38691 Transcript_11108/m.38691 type:complete len:206 (-) Transcript_11108:2382-2999(-)